MKTLPLFYYPSTCILVDDDQFLLSMMSSMFDNKNPIRSFSSPLTCLDFLKNFSSPLSNHCFIESDLNDENYGLINKNPRNFDLTKIAQLCEDPKRHDEITVMVLDYKMPEMSGIELGQHLQNTSIQKILLTGNACDLKAIEGFNHNIIQKYIQKGSDNTRNNLLQYIKELSTLFFTNYTKPLLNYLETDRKIPLSDPVFIDFFEDFCEKNNIAEFYLIDINGSFLCITHQSIQFVLVIHTENSLKEWVCLYENNTDFSDRQIRLILDGGKIPFFGIGKEAWQLPAFDFGNNFHTAKKLQGRENYFYSILYDL